MVTFYKFSTSLHYIDTMFEKRYTRYNGMFQDIVVVVTVFIVVCWVLIKMFLDKTNKIQTQIRGNFKVYNELDNGKGRIEEKEE